MKKIFVWLFRVVQGALIGTGAILPGVSGGAMCAAFGIYEIMMNFIAHPIKSFKKNIQILVPVLIGAVIGFVLLAKAVTLLIEANSIIAMSLFAGLICGTVPGLAKDAVEKDAKKGWAGFIIALALSFVLFTFLASDAVSGSIVPSFGWFVFCGAVWALSFIVPGLSSSSILLFMGLYKPMSEGIGNLDFSVLLPMGLGFLPLVLLSARGVNHLLDKHGPAIRKTIIGFVISSVIIIIPPLDTMAGLDYLWAALSFFGGFAVALLMDLWGAKIKPQEA